MPKRDLIPRKQKVYESNLMMDQKAYEQNKKTQQPSVTTEKIMITYEKM